MGIQPYYKQLPKFTVSGLILSMQTWRFSCGAIDPANPAYIFRDLPALDIIFAADPAFDKSAMLCVVPTATAGDNYYLTEWSSDPSLAQTSNPPVEKWTPGISVVPCLNIVIKAGATTLEVAVNEFDLPSPLDLKRDIVSGGWHIKAAVSQPTGFELLDATKHATAFPISLGKLESGEKWYAEVAK